MSAHLIIHALRGLAWVGEHFPDDPRLANKLLAGGSSLFLTLLIPTTSADWYLLVIVLQVLSAIAGSICLLLGVFVYFRRAVWAWQDKRGSGIVEMKLQDPRRAVKQSLFEE